MWYQASNHLGPALTAVQVDMLCTASAPCGAGLLDCASVWAVYIEIYMYIYYMYSSLTGHLDLQL